MDHVEKDIKGPALDPKEYARNRKTTFLIWMSALESFLWAHNKGTMKYLLITNREERIADDSHPSSHTARGRESHKHHQAQLRHMIFEAFNKVEPTIVGAHPPTNNIDPATGHCVAFGSNCLLALKNSICPTDCTGNTSALRELNKRLHEFPGLRYGIPSLKAWTNDVTRLFNNIKASGLIADDEMTVCTMTLILQAQDQGTSIPYWTRCVDQFASVTGAERTMPAYLCKILSFVEQEESARHLVLGSSAVSKRFGNGKHFNPVFNATAVDCWVCKKNNHDAKDCNMLKTALDQYRNRHLHNGKSHHTPFRKTKHHQNGGRPSTHHNSSFKQQSTKKPPQHKHPYKHAPHGKKTSSTSKFPAANSALLPPPPPYTAPSAPSSQVHFAFLAGHCNGANNEGLPTDELRFDHLAERPVTPPLGHKRRFTSLDEDFSLPPSKRQPRQPMEVTFDDSSSEPPSLIDSSSGSEHNDSKEKMVSNVNVNQEETANTSIYVNNVNLSQDDADCISHALKMVATQEEFRKMNINSVTADEAIISGFLPIKETEAPVAVKADDPYAGLSRAVIAIKTSGIPPYIEYLPSIRTDAPSPHLYISAQHAEDPVHIIKVSLPPDLELIKYTPEYYFLNEITDLISTSSADCPRDNFSVIAAKIIAFNSNDLAVNWHFECDLPKSLCVQMHNVPYTALPHLIYCYQVGLFAKAYLDANYGNEFEVKDFSFHAPIVSHIEYNQEIAMLLEHLSEHLNGTSMQEQTHEIDTNVSNARPLTPCYSPTAPSYSLIEQQTAPSGTLPTPFEF